MLIAGIILLPILIVQYAKTKAKSKAANGFGANTNSFQSSNGFGQMNANPYQSPNGFGQTNNNPFQAQNGFGQTNNNPFQAPTGFETNNNPFQNNPYQTPNGYGMNTSFQADAQTTKKLATLRALIIFDIILVAALAAVVVYGVYKNKGGIGGSSGTEYSENETISSDPMTKDFVKTDYAVDGDAVVFDENNVKLTITGFYTDPETKDLYHGDTSAHYIPNVYGSYLAGDTAIEYKLENNSDVDVSFTVSCIGINGIADNYGYSYETVKANSTITFYQENTNARDGVIKDFEINIGDIYVPYDSYDTSNNNVKFLSQGVKKFTTTADYSYEQLELPGGSEPIYDDHGVRIYQAKLSKYSSDDKELCLIIYNDTDDTAEISCDQYKIDGVQSTDSSIHIFSDEKIPSNYVMISDDVNDAYLEAGTKDWKEIELSISFKFDEHPENDFSTGYIKAMN